MVTVKTGPDLDAKHGVQSAETVLQILNAFIGAESSPMLKTLAERAGMHPAKVHRYLVSLSRMGYVEQDQETSRYRLGPMTMRLGYTAMNAVDIIRVTRPLMFGLAQSMNNNVLLAVWNDNGPLIVLKESPPGPIMMSINEGHVVPILRSAIGRAFGAWLPRSKTIALIERELELQQEDPQPNCPTNLVEVDALFHEIRSRGIVRVTGQYSNLMHSFSAPIFNSASELEAVLCVAGPAATFNSTWTSPTRTTLLQACATLSRGLGYDPAN